MRRILLACMTMCLTATCTLADEQKDITLSDDHNKETITLPSLCNIFVTFEQESFESGTYSIYVENLSEENSLLFFQKAYDEKQLKNMYPKILFNSKFGGSKGYRLTEVQIGLKNEFVKVDPSDKKAIIETRPINANKTEDIILPIYIAKQKKKGGKVELMEENKVELHISMEAKPDEEYLRLKDDVEDFISRLNDKPFCTNRRHKVPLEEQIEEYENERKALVERIDTIYNVREYMITDDRYKPFGQLRDKLQEIDCNAEQYQTGDCGDTELHNKPTPKRGHKCKYCGLSLAQIYHKIDDYYQKVYSNRDAKSSVMADVRMLYDCCTSPKCSKHAAEWRKGGSYKTRIIDRYNRINAL